MNNLMQDVIIPPTSGAVVSGPFTLSQDGSSMSIIGSGYQSGEYARLELYDPALESWVDAIGQGNTFQLDENNNWFDVFQSWTQFRINKSATADEVGVTVRQYRTYRG